jgi:hypothetical protein
MRISQNKMSPGVAIAIVVAISGCVKKENITLCERDLQPTVRVTPKLPPKLHNEFRGNAEVEYIVTPHGEVRDARIVSVEWRPIGNSGGQPQGYEEAILKAVGEWKYAPVGRSCMATKRITFMFED